MTKPTTDIAEDIDLDLDLGAMSREILEGTAHQCANDGYSFDEIRTDVEKLNQAFMPPLPQSDIEQLLAKYNPAIVNKNRVLDAIQKQDVRLLEQCLRYIAIVKRRDFAEYNQLYFQIKEAFKGKLDLRLFNNKLYAEVRNQEEEEQGKKPDVATLVRQWVGQNRDTFAWDEARQCLRMWNGDYWQEQPEKSPQMDQYAVAAMQDAGLQVNTQGSLNLFIRLATGRLVREFKPVEGKINFANGTLDLATMKLRNHDRDDNFTSCLSYGYNPYADCRGIVRYLRELILERDDTGQFITNEHGVQALMAHGGLALIGDTSLHKAVMALGAAGAGKSTLLDLINLLCGLEVKQYVPRDVFSGELEGKRSRYTHNQKRVACIDEVPADAFEDEETVKQMIAHSGVSMRGLHKDEQIDNKWKPKLLLNANDDPHYKDISGAIKRRLIVIRCPIQRYEEPMEGQLGQDPLLLEKLVPEMGAFAAVCIRLALAVRERGFYPQSAAMKRDLDQLATAGNPLKACLAEKFIPDSTAHTFTRELHAVYVRFCEDEMGKNSKPLGSPKFASALCSMSIGITAKKLNGQRALLGIRLRDENEPIPGEAAYQDSTLVIDAGRLDGKMDGWDGYRTAVNGSCPHDKTALQATSQTQWTARTANSGISHKLNGTISHEGDNIYIPSIEKEFPDSAVQPSTDSVKPPVVPFHSMDSTNLQPSVQPSSRPHTLLEIGIPAMPKPPKCNQQCDSPNWQPYFDKQQGKTLWKCANH